MIYIHKIITFKKCIYGILFTDCRVAMMLKHEFQCLMMQLAVMLKLCWLQTQLTLWRSSRIIHIEMLDASFDKREQVVVIQVLLDFS